jgi:cobalt/nickel transport system ATP-binding protein
MRPVVEVRDLWFGFDGANPVLRGVSFCVHEGERLGIVGANGAGKSTLLWCLLGLYKARGEVKLFGEPVRRGLLARAGVVFQNPEDMLFMPALEGDLALPLVNRGAGKAEAQERAREALRRVGLEGYEGRPASSLSLGQRKRAAIAAAVVTAPELLILDEPTAELDGRAVRMVADLVRDMGVTTLITSHDLGFLGGVATRVLVLDGGAIVAGGAPGEIFSDRARLDVWGLV